MGDRKREIVQWLIEYRAVVLLAIVVVLALLFVPYFPTEINITQMLTQLSVEGVVSVGITILMIAWGMARSGDASRIMFVQAIHPVLMNTPTSKTANVLRSRKKPEMPDTFMD